jgi:hypothetical protein
MSEKENLLECSLTYGDASSCQNFMLKGKTPLSYNYDCTFIMTPKTGKKPDYNEWAGVVIPYYSTKFEYTPRGEKFFDYKLKEIHYELREDKDKEGNMYKRIQHLKLIFINKKMEEEVLLDTSNGKNLPEKIALFEGEVIEYANVYLKDELLCGISLTTNESKILNKSYKIGTTDLDNDDDIQLIKKNKKIIVGLGCEANEETGINSIYFYLTPISNSHECGTFGLRQLRAKVKKNDVFNEEIDKMKNNLNEEEKIIYDICTFPDTLFFNILKYASSY